MDRWKCTVCGYLHDGDTPPESCPLCGVAAEKFTRNEDEATASQQQEKRTEGSVSSDKTWKCSVCGHLHKGDLPPDNCPICMVEAEKFSVHNEVVEDVVTSRETDDSDAQEELEVKTWKCSVCGYIHEGPTPPEKCPLCGVPAEKFIVVTKGSKESVAVEEKVSEPVSSVTGEERQWKCATCGYVHKGVALPEVCPLCGVPKERFVEGASEKKTSHKVEETTAQPQSFIVKMIQKHHVHPIVVHFPNGILPLVVVFNLLALLGCGESFDVAAYYNMVGVLLTIPLVAYSGYVEWGGRYRSARTLPFKIKIGSSVLMTLLLVVLLLWRTFVPDVILAQDTMSYTYCALSGLMVVFAGVTGHIGGTFVFNSRG